MIKYICGFLMTLSAHDAPAQNAYNINNVPINRVVKMPSEHVLIHQPQESWGYSHHASVEYFKGKLYTTYSSGVENEDDCGQRIMISSSDDFHNWTPSVPLVDSMMGNDSLLVLVNGGLYVRGDVMTAYFGSYEYAPESLRGENLRPLQDVSRINYCMWIAQTTNGVTWTAPQQINTIFSCNHAPMPLQSGRLLLGGGAGYPYTDDPAGVTGYSVGWINAADAVSRGAATITEGSFFQKDNGVIYMMLRTNTDYLWCSESHDDGVTWSAANPTQFTDAKSKFMFGRLDDGRYYYVGNPVPGSDRNPLALSLSSDGVNFNKQYVLRDEPYTKLLDGLYKTGLYGYPGVTVRNGYMYIVYSKRKEAVEITRVKIDDVGLIARWDFSGGSSGESIDFVDSVVGAFAASVTENANPPNVDVTYLDGFFGTGTCADMNGGAFLKVPDNDVLTGHHDGFSGFSGFSIDMNVFLDAMPSSTAVLLRKGNLDNSNNPGYSIYVTSSGAVCFRMAETVSGASTAASAAGTIVAGVPYRVTATWDGMYMRLYVNNSQVASKGNSFGGDGFNLNSIGALTIGGSQSWNNVYDQRVDGKIGNVSLYDEAIVPGASPGGI